MAITVDQGENRGKVFKLAGSVAIVVALLIATYVLFFTTPPQIEVFAPQEVETISRISEIELNPSAIINSPEYKSLTGDIPLPTLGQVGRANPFSRF